MKAEIGASEPAGMVVAPVHDVFQLRRCKDLGLSNLDSYPWRMGFIGVEESWSRNWRGEGTFEWHERARER